jgi:sulfur carrier protein ThiS
MDQVDVELHGPLTKYVDSQERPRVQAHQSIQEAAAELGIPPTHPLVALVNGRVRDLDYHLRPGDKVRLLIPIAGG